MKDIDEQLDADVRVFGMGLETRDANGERVRIDPRRIRRIDWDRRTVQVAAEITAIAFTVSVATTSP